MKQSDQAKILIVDDEERICRSLDSLLTKAGYQVQTATDGKKALQLYQQGHFDLLVSDIKLPGLDGIHLLEEIRKRDADAVVILMTAYASLDTAVAAINMGAYDYLVKPVEFTQLKLAVKRALEKRELELASKKLLEELQDKNQLLNRRVAEVDALYQASISLSQSHDLNKLLTKIIELALQVIGATVGSVMLLDDATGELTISAAIGLSDEVRRSTRIKLGNSIAGYVAEKGEALLIEDINNDPRFARFGKGNYETNSLISAPLKLKERVLGVINLSDPSVGTEFQSSDLRLLVTFAAQAAIAIDDAENYQQLTKKLDEMAALYELATEITSVDNPRDMTDLIYQSLKKIIDVDLTVWLAWVERSETLVFNYWEGFGKKEAAELMGVDVPINQKSAFASQVCAPLIMKRIEEIPYFRDQIKSLTALPIITKGSFHGIFCLGSCRQHAFSDNDAHIASIVASQATSMYEQQRAVLTATRLVTMGRMMSEIGHDLKKPLTSISGSLQIMRDRWPEITQSDDFFQTAEQELLRLNELVKELVDFSNPTKYHLEQKRVGDLIKRVMRLVTSDLKKHQISFTQELEEGLPGVMVNENEIVELLLNLIINAIDAMPNGGKLSFKAFPESDPETNKPYVVLRIADTGEGIPLEVQHKVFDRYFTTKETGTGLGLAICERIVMAHEGQITFESKKGTGTTFVIKLPAA